MPKMALRGPRAQTFLPHQEISYPLPILSEPLVVVELAALRLAPVYYGLGIPYGNGSAVVLVPGFMGTDFWHFELFAWLRRIGYRPYASDISFAADCPNVLASRLDETIDRAFSETGRRVHLIGHSLGGIFARSAAVRRPKRIASVITLGSPFRGLVIHQLVLAIANAVREIIRECHDERMPRECATSRCSCRFGRSLQRPWPRFVSQTALYSRQDGIVDWRYCLTGKPSVDVEVSGTHLGLIFNASVYEHIALRLAGEAARAAKHCAAG